ncbi:MAG: carbohydrate ABC transporter substrate-binding protein, partial [Cyanobacteria bacterium P01_A01_bin.114]
MNRQKLNRRKFTRLSLYFLASLAVVGCTQGSDSFTETASPSSESALTIWWQEGFYPEEIDALSQIIAEWETENETQVNLTVIPQKDILQEVENAIADGTPP